jgi:hypothetical protein
LQKEFNDLKEKCESGDKSLAEITKAFDDLKEELQIKKDLSKNMLNPANFDPGNEGRIKPKANNNNSKSLINHTQGQGLGNGK